MISACAGLVISTSRWDCDGRSVNDCSVHSLQWQPAPCSAVVSVCTSVLDDCSGSGSGHSLDGTDGGEGGVGCGGAEVVWLDSCFESGSGMGVGSGGHSTWAGSVGCEGGGGHSSFGIGLVGVGVSGHCSTGAGQALSVGLAGVGHSSGIGRSQTHSQRDSNSL